MTNREFKVGDEVSYGGLLGKIVNITIPISGNYPYPISVKFEDGSTNTFMMDGRIHIKHKIPLLILVKPVKEQLTVYVNVYKSESKLGPVNLGRAYLTKEEAEKQGSGLNYISTQSITVEI